MSDPADVPPTTLADDGLLAPRQLLGRHAGVFIAPAEVADAAPERPARVLVAGDHLAPGRGFPELLDAQPDFRVIAAVSCAEEALAIAERERIDAALVDYKLGDHDGLWVSRELKRLSRPPRVVLRCDYPNGLPAAAAVVAEADALVSTAATGAELCRAIRSTLDGRPVLPTIPPAVEGRMREVFDVEEQAVLARMLAGIPRPDRQHAGRVLGRAGPASLADAQRAGVGAMTRMMTSRRPMRREPAGSEGRRRLPGRRYTSSAGGQYPRTGVARQYGLRGPGTPALWGGRDLRLNVTFPALSRKETREHEHHGDSFR